MKLQNLIFTVSLILGLSSCSTLSKSECEATDWEQIGFEDGEKGIAATSNTAYKESCANFEVDVDQQAYSQGHIKGMNLFCQAENGFEFGEQGYKYSVVCPQEFEDEYAVGYQFYIAHSNLNEMEKTLLTNNATINKLEIGVNSATLRLNNDALPVTEENELRLSIESMTSQIKDYELANDRIEPILRERQQHLRVLRERYRR